jgi:protein SCO1
VRSAAQRRNFLQGIGVLGSGFLLAGFYDKWKLDPQDLSPENSFGFGPLKFTMTDAETGKTVTETDFRGKIVMLYFGYTNCPDVCPLTLSNTVRVFHRIGAKAKDIRFLFVTVDPRRDTVPVLKDYVSLFGAGNIIGLRGTEAELKAAAARVGVRYSVHPSPDPAKYTVTHTWLIYVFNRQGTPEFTIAGLSSPDPDFKGVASDLAHLVSINRV